MKDESKGVMAVRKNTATTSSELGSDFGTVEHETFDRGHTSSRARANNDASRHQQQYSFVQRRAVSMANRPYLYFGITSMICVVLSVLGIVFGEFKVTVDQTGWLSRGTTISKRHAQYILAYYNREQLHQDQTGEVWDDMLNNVQPGWETASLRRRRLAVTAEDHSESASGPSVFERKLQSAGNTSILSNCDLTWYGEDMIFGNHLWPVWKVNDVSAPNVLLNHDTFLDLCLSEETTQKYLEENSLCFGCFDDGCLPPYSVILFARVTVPDGLYADCVKLAADWVTYNEKNPAFQDTLFECVDDLKIIYDIARDGADLPGTCPDRFAPTIVDTKFDAITPISYTSSIFATKVDDESIRLLYENVDQFGKGTQRIEGTYDTKRESFVQLEINRVIVGDMILATGSAVITTLAILVHTRSPFLTLIGFLQIILSFPLAYFFYTFVAGLTFFPFLNFIGIFVLFALGADDIFVAVDKWKNARIELGPDAETSEVAARALPDAALSMFLTSLTTAVAFFATAVCPVAPILCFAVFCGLLIVVTYVLCVLMVFPGLCIYDKASMSREKLRDIVEENEEDNDSMTGNTDQGQSFIRRRMASFYEIIHFCRYGLLVAILVTFSICAVFASRMEIPTNGDIRLLRPGNEFEKNNQWRQNLLVHELEKEKGTSTFVMWGVTPADTGKHSNPESFSQLVLDESFQPSQRPTQIYLLDFCEKIYKNDFAERVEGELCTMSEFDTWLKSQYHADQKDQVYLDHCGNSTGIPTSESDFDACMSNWSQKFGKNWVLSHLGKVKIMFVRFKGRIRYDSPFDDIKKEWHLIEDWIEKERRNVAPPGIGNMYFTSDDYWWYDTNAGMISTAYVSAAIAITIGAAVILFTSLSFMLTLFSAFAICYVLVSVTAGLVALGWTLGFVEAICFSILIGISCDFVIHFTHSYAFLRGDVDRHTRTKMAVIEMGPSVLAAAFTTFAAAVIMLFTSLTFFVKFAIILLSTIVQTTLASFFVFLVIADIFGPSQPASFVYKLWSIMERKENIRKDDF